jgi:hypothetical protein
MGMLLMWRVMDGRKGVGVAVIVVPRRWVIVACSQSSLTVTVSTDITVSRTRTGHARDGARAVNAP